jgi:hypothetical protein
LGLFWGIKALLLLFLPPLAVIILFVLLGIYALPGIGYFLPLGLFGGYDEHTLEDLRKAVELSGPSKFIVRLWYVGAQFGSKMSPLYRKFPMAYQNVAEEVHELMLSKKQQQSRIIDKNS